ncbi:MAG: glucose-1-phosphate thymidylyltransferase [Parcubacteria group bacterium]|jgi:glucose-1-phosphate thymidylyltransferase|nr:glucose-1-phosphate thymidylyltransferase [Parcubacteria group bacterium]|tara:strand:- start:7405 stop:8268 length:864 start_codon:yes stop_codon:yes gene_type:complete
MKGIILAGGVGTRLGPITTSYSKQLVPIYDKPLIYYPLSSLMELNIKDILIITTENQLENFKRLLKNGSQWGVNINYAVQNFPKGIAEAFIIGENFIKNSNVALILGDNIFYGQDLNNEISSNKFQNGGLIFLNKVVNPSDYGVAIIKNNKIKHIKEKPKIQKSNLAVTGLYLYDKNVSKIAKKLKPSKRNELEITDLNNFYNKEYKLNYIELNSSTVWFDAGTTNSLLQASQYIQAIQERNNLLVGSPEETSYRKKYITKNEFKKLIKSMPNNSYSLSLKRYLVQS